jgi:protein-tyrosine phosphatase
MTHRCSIVSSVSPDAIPPGNPAETTSLTSSPRFYDRTVMSGDRHVSFEACFNFRDLGGYETVDGRRVRWGAVFRSDSLHRLTDTDLDAASSLGIQTMIDLRSTAELDRQGRFAHADDVAFHHLPLFEEHAPTFKPAEPGDPEPPPGVHYVAMATHAHGSIAQAVRVIAEGDYAVVFHCAAGKDWTGILAALVLAGLGVPDEVIVADYHLSERSLPRALAWAEANAPEMAAEIATMPPWVLRAPMPVMQAFLDILRDHHGSIDAYLADAGVEPPVLDTLRSRLLTTD